MSQIKLQIRSASKLESLSATSLFYVNGQLFMRTSTTVPGLILCYTAGSEDPAWLSVTTMVAPVDAIIDPGPRSAVLAVAELIEQAAVSESTPETTADHVLRGLGVPDDWTEADLRRWVEYGVTVGR